LDFVSSEDPFAECIEENDTQDKLGSAPETLTNEVQEFNFTQTRDFSARVCRGDLSSNFILLLDSNKKLNTMTGIPSYQILNEIVELFSLISELTNSVLKKKLFLYL